MKDLNSYRHTCSHIMAQAVKRLWPNTRLAIGPVIENGFYYDFESDEVFTPDRLEELETEMKRIIKEDLPIERFSLSEDEAVQLMKERDEPYKLELIGDIPDGEELSFYRQGEFVDLCAGPHCLNTGSVKAFKLTHVAERIGGDDAHIVCTEEQFVDEINRVLDFAIEMNRVFGFDRLKVYLSVRDLENKEAKYIGEERVWNLAETTLENLLMARGIDVIKDVGGAKFYGPAIDLKAVDAMNREWQGTTIQLDMNLPARFGMTYTGSDGGEHVPIMLHHTLLGSMERFVGVLIEHYAGAFPTWLAPVQVGVITVTSRSEEYGAGLVEMLRERDIRAEEDFRAEKVGLKIREAQLSKIPYMLIVGDKEAADGTVSVRSGKNGDMGIMSINEFIEMIENEIKTKAK
ncbi:threonine-trna ligase [Holotrichia oblita]|nr:threonine-trna ligase [Holotrichia oblita]